MSLAVLHRTLSVSANEEVEDGVERLLRIAHHVSERPALTVRKEIVTGYGQFGHSLPLWCMCRSQTAQRQGKDPSNGAIQNGYIDILRLPRRITITRVATMPGAIMTPILPGRMGYTGYPPNLLRTHGGTCLQMKSSSSSSSSSSSISSSSSSSSSSTSVPHH